MPILSRKTVIKLKNISKIYQMGEIKVKAIDHCSLVIPDAQFIVILGPSGSGKTTLLNLIGAIDTPTDGEIYVLEKPIHDLSRKELTKVRRDDIGFIFQFYNLIPTLTALENVMYALSLQPKAKKLGSNQIRKRAKKVLEKVGLNDRVHHFPRELSGGEQQRVAIARAIAKNPRVILADEPTGELDYETGIKILRLLHNMVKIHQISIVFVTHNREIARIANQVIFLRSGKVVDIERNENPKSPEELEW